MSSRSKFPPCPRCKSSKDVRPGEIEVSQHLPLFNSDIEVGEHPFFYCAHCNTMFHPVASTEDVTTAQPNADGADPKA